MDLRFHWLAIGWPLAGQEQQGKLWGAPGSSGEHWGAPRSTGELWGALGSSGVLWGALGSSGARCGGLAGWAERAVEEKKQKKKSREFTK